MEALMDKKDDWNMMDEDTMQSTKKPNSKKKKKQFGSDRPRVRLFML